MKRKTVNVKALVEEVNRRNRHSTCAPDVRQGWNSLLETVLHLTNNYDGYGYYIDEDLGESIIPGVRYETNESGVRVPCKDYKERFRDTDDTRRFYYFRGSKEVMKLSFDEWLERYA